MNSFKLCCFFLSCFQAIKGVLRFFISRIFFTCVFYFLAVYNFSVFVIDWIFLFMRFFLTRCFSFHFWFSFFAFFPFYRVSENILEFHFLIPPNNFILTMPTFIMVNDFVIFNLSQDGIIPPHPRPSNHGYIKTLMS